jgi:hypothetical protein
MADAQDLGWFQTRPRVELKALSFGSHGAISYLSGIGWADRGKHITADCGLLFIDKVDGMFRCLPNLSEQ